MEWSIEAIIAMAGVGLFGITGLLSIKVVRRERTTGRDRIAEATRWIEVQLKAEEAVRQRVSLELHDNILQQLYGLTLELQIKPLATSATLTALKTLSEDVRRVAHGLYPPEPEAAGLAEAIRVLVDDWKTRRGIPIELRCHIARVCPRDLTMPVYRVIQEAIHNAATHGYATGVLVTLSETNGGLAFEVVDDGEGFDVNSSDFVAGLGLLSMQARLGGLGGSVEILSRPTMGTCVKGWVPWRD